MPIREFCGLMVCLLVSSIAWAADSGSAAEGHTDHHPHHIGLFVGYGTESKDDKEEEGFAIGVEYEWSFTERWGVGAVFEGLGQDTIRDYLLIVPVSYHPAKRWRLFAGPGVEFTEKKDKLAFRLGAGYKFELGGAWSLSPELLVDMIETGENTWVAGLALGYGF